MKNLIVGLLRGMPGNRMIYPCVVKVWKRFVTPLRRRRLQKHGVKVLGELHEVLTRLNVRYYVYWGTLLGIVREGNFITNDDDIDLSVDPQTVDFGKLHEALCKKGFSFLHSIQTKDRPLYYTFSRMGLQVDFFCEIGSANDGMIYSPVTRCEPGVRYEGFQTGWRKVLLVGGGAGQIIDFKGIKISVPLNVERVLESMYGRSLIPDIRGLLFMRRCRTLPIESLISAK